MCVCECDVRTWRRVAEFAHEPVESSVAIAADGGMLAFGLPKNIVVSDFAQR